MSNPLVAKEIERLNLKLVDQEYKYILALEQINNMTELINSIIKRESIGLKAQEVASLLKAEQYSKTYKQIML